MTVVPLVSRPNLETLPALFVQSASQDSATYVLLLQRVFYVPAE